MNGESIYTALESINDGAIEEALKPALRQDKLRAGRIIQIAAAACLLAALAAAMIAGGILEKKKTRTAYTEPSEQPPVPTEPSPTKAYDDPSTQSGQLLRFFKHEGCMYYAQRVLPSGADIFGERIGTAYYAAAPNKKNEDYGELAGSMNGSVFKVKGVDPGLFLCMREQNGSVLLFLNETKCDFVRGSDLFEDMLHIGDSSMKLRIVESGNDKDSYYELDPEHATALDGLISLMDSGECMMQPAGSISELGKSMDLLLCRDDGLAVNIIVWRGGFVELADHRIAGKDMHLRFKVDADELNSLMDEIEENTFDIPDDEFRTTEDLASCAKDERLGKYVPRSIPEGYELLFAVIHRKVDEQTGALLDTEWIEFELRDAAWHYICADIYYYGSAGELPNRVDYEKKTAVLYREDAIIELKGEFGVTEEVFREFVESFGE